MNTRQQEGIKSYIEPSKDGMRNFKRKVSDIIGRAYGGDLVTLMESLNYLICGTANC